MQPRQRALWPATATLRWAVRLGLALPYAVIVLIAEARGITSESNEALETSSRAIEWGADQLDFVDQIYPPLPVALASVLPGGAIVSGFAGALLAGVVLHVLAQRLVERAVPTWLVAMLVSSVGALAGFVFLSSQDLARFMGVTFLFVAVAGMLRFAMDADTEGGFQCGLALGVAVLCDPATAVFAVFTGIAALFIAFQRYRQEPGAATATLAVVIFPTVAAFAGWAFLEWRFTGGAFATVRATDEFWSFPGGFGNTFKTEATGVLRGAIECPVFIVGVGLLARRRPVAAVGSVIMLFALALSGTFGLGVGVGRAVVLIAGAGAMTVPRLPGRPVQIVLAVSVVVQIALSWFAMRGDTPLGGFVEQLI